MDYLKAIDRLEVSVTLGADTYRVKRASLRQFFLMYQISQDEDDRIAQYMAVALGVPYELVLSWDGLEVLEAYQIITDLNRPQSIQLDFAQEPKDNKFNYANRALAGIVTTIASGFGWTKDYILDELTYDEARCYVQELLLKEYSKQEFEYNISDAGYNSSGKKSAFPPPPFPPMIPSLQQQATPVNKPSDEAVGVVGTVISFEDFAREKEKQHA